MKLFDVNKKKKNFERHANTTSNNIYVDHAKFNKRKTVCQTQLLSVK